MPAEPTAADNPESVTLMQSRHVQWALWALVVLLVFRFAWFAADVAVRPSNGFAAYYTAGRLIAAGSDASRFYDDAWFRAEIARHGPAVNDIYNVNPPTTALLLLPLAGLDYAWARIIWTLVGLACLAGAVFWIFSERGLRGVWVPGFSAFVLLYQPLYANSAQGQVYVLILFLLVTAWHGYRHGRAWLLGAAIGLMLILKTAGLLLWILLLMQRRWRALAWGGATTLLVGLGSLPWLGTDAWRNYFRFLPRLSAQPEMAVTAYQTQLGFFRHFFTLDARWNPTPLFDWPELGTWLPWLGIAALGGVSAYIAYTTPHTDLVFAAFVVASLILSPVSQDYHFTLLILPIAILLTWVTDRSLSWPAILLGVAMVLLAADFPYRSPQLTAGAWALLAYPKLYAACILWGLAVWPSRHDASV